MRTKAALGRRGARLAAGLALLFSLAHAQRPDSSLIVEVDGETATLIADRVPLARIIEAIALRTGIIVYSKASLSADVTTLIKDEPIPSVIRTLLRNHNFTLHYASDAASGEPVFGSRLWILADGDSTATPVWSVGEPAQDWTHRYTAGDPVQNRLQVLSNVETWENDASTNDDLLVALTDPAGAVRAEAASVLGEIASPQTVTYLEKMLFDPQKRVRIAAIDALADSGYGDAAMALAPLLQDADPDIRREVIDALAEIDDEIARQLLTEALADETEINRETAAGYIAETATTRTANRF